MPKSPRPSRPLALLTLLSTATLAGCASLGPTPATEPAAPPASLACTAFPRISYSRLHDTDETIRQVLAYDAARDALCGKGK